MKESKRKRQGQTAIPRKPSEEVIFNVNAGGCPTDCSGFFGCMWKILGEVVEKRQIEAHRRSGKEKKDEAGYHWKEP